MEWASQTKRLGPVAFARLGKVRRGLMIDLRATNEKLHDRAIRILLTLFPDRSREEAARELAAHGGCLRTAVESIERRDA